MVFSFSSTWGAVKEELHMKYIDLFFKNDKVILEDLLKEGIVKRTVTINEEGQYELSYVVIPDSISSMGRYGKGNANTGKDIFKIDKDFNVRYIDKDGNEYGDKIEIIILEDETDIRFVSEEFSKYISKISGVTEGEMKFKWMKNQTSLTINDASVESLDDLVFFRNLTELTLENLQLESLRGIENCVSLKNFYCKSALKNFSKDDAKNLSSCNDLEVINFEYLDGQESFDNLMDGIVDKEKIYNMQVKYSKIDNIKKIANLSCSNLRIIDFSGNNIKDIDGLEKFEKIYWITMNGNDISDILQFAEISSLNNLRYLELRNNEGIKANREEYSDNEIIILDKIGEILDRGGDIVLDLEKLSLFENYKKLTLASKELTDLTAIEGMTELESLAVAHNKILLNDEKSKNILSSMTNLNHLDMQYNGQVNISVLNNLENLKTLYIMQGNNVTLDLQDIEDIISNLTTLLCNELTFNTITNCDSEKITAINVSLSPIQIVPELSKFTKLKNLSITSNKYTTADYSAIEDLTSLEILNLASNDLHEDMIDLSKLTNLKTLNLSKNNLWSEELTNLAGLKNNTNMTIDLSNNSIINANALLVLDPSTKINLKNNVNLTQESKDALTARFGSNVSY